MAGRHRCPACARCRDPVHAVLMIQIKEKSAIRAQLCYTSSDAFAERFRRE
jgi:hypothetical protein